MWTLYPQYGIGARFPFLKNGRGSACFCIFRRLTTIQQSGSTALKRRHREGFTPITCDLGNIAQAGDTAVIVVRARDDNKDPKPRGKQSTLYHNKGCQYTRTTGISQTVWMEPVPEAHLQRPRLTPDIANGVLHISQPVRGQPRGYPIKVTLLDSREAITSAECSASANFTPSLHLKLPEERLKLRSPESPFLYDLKIELLNASGEAVDQASSYAEMRSVTIDGKAIKLNGKPVFQRLILDQGYYPDGIMTAPTDDALRRNIELSMKAGFNSARLHQKVLEERFFIPCR